MSGSESPVTEPIPPERLAEASVWIARLHGDARGPAMENGFRRWLQEDPVNARAFELATDVWNEAANLRRSVPPAAIPHRQAPGRLHGRSRARVRVAWAALVAAVSVLIVVGFALHRRADEFGTAVGEQRLLTLDDGTRIYLNTATRVVVNYDDRARRVELKAGEAIFDVAKRPGWPFVVTVGDRQVTALGTSFLVRRDEQRVAVTLMEGKVVVSALPPSVAAPDDAGSAAPEQSAARVSQPNNESFMMVPGERLTFVDGAFSQLDTPSIDKTTAWRRGQVVLDDTPLAAAAVEMNRYNSVKLVIEDTQAGNLLVNGLFQAGDSLRFANAVAQTYGLRVIEQEEAIILSGAPRH